MIWFTDRWKFAISILGIVSFAAAIQTLFVVAVCSFFGILSSETGWKEFLALFGVVLITTAVVACILVYWLIGRLVRHKGAAEGRAAFSEIAVAVEAEHREQVADWASDHMDRFTQSLIHHSSDAIFVLDLQGRIQKVNPAFEELYGYRPFELLAAPQPLVPSRLKEESIQLIERVRKGLPVNGYETIRVTKDGREIHVSLTLSPILDENGAIMAIAAISRNITERKETEELLRRSEKLTLIGQLAAGVAHEIRNPLTTLRGFVQLLQERNSGSGSHLRLMLEELDRINLIVSEFIILSKPHLNQFLFKDLNVLLSDLSRVLEPQANLNNIMLDIRLESGIPKIRCEENQLKQVFLNIVKNGMEAMPEGGVIHMEARRVDPSWVLVRIKDHGGGIPEELLCRLGEPFISNKENGTGLGIMVSQRIIAHHKGHMVVRSELGKGTCVDVVLPVDFEKQPNDNLSTKINASPSH